MVENEKQMVILMEWLRGGHLLDHLEEMAGQHYSEQQAAILFVQVSPFPLPLTIWLASITLSSRQPSCMFRLGYKPRICKYLNRTACPSEKWYASPREVQVKQPFCCEGWFKACFNAGY